MQTKINRREFLKGAAGITLTGVPLLKGCTWLERLLKPLPKIDPELKGLLAKDLKLEWSRELKKIVNQTTTLRQKLYPMEEVVGDIIHKWEAFHDFLNEDGVSEQELYQSLTKQPDLLILGWTHNYGNRTAEEVAQSISTYLDSGGKINFFLLEGLPRGSKLAKDFNQGRISPDQLVRKFHPHIPGGSLSPYGALGWGRPIFETLRERNIKLMGFRREGISTVEWMKNAPRWTKEAVEQNGPGAVMIGKSHINSYLFHRQSAIHRLVGSKEKFLEAVKKLGKKVFVAAVPINNLVVDLYSQSDYSLYWDTFCGLTLWLTREEDRFTLFKSLTNRWSKEVKRMKEELVYPAPRSTQEKVFPDHEIPVIVPPTPTYLNATFIYLTQYPEQLTRNFAVQPRLQGDFSQYNIIVKGVPIKIMELNPEGKVNKIILPPTQKR